ncbi:MAG: Uroporphyrinogen decarboxylase [candidate division WS2 bacterium]|nr:Uroporphyrinogen decarboxylase [Candidatus Psychracetigena formicireducens]
MTSKERMLVVLRNEQPDMVPVAPDISNMIPCRLTGKPFWEIYLQDPLSGEGGYPLGEAYLEAVKYFGFDAWDQYGSLGPSKEEKREFQREIIEKDAEKIVAKESFHTPEGTLSQEIVYSIDNSPAPRKMLVKDFKKDFPLFLKYWFPDPSSCDDSKFHEWKTKVGDLGIVGLVISFPGFQSLVYTIDGGDRMSSLEALTYAYYDYPDLLREYVFTYENWATKMTERILKAKPDYVLISASGTITLQSPEIFRELGLPTLKKITRLCKKSEVPTILHSCGKEKELVKICVEETDLSCINPLEVPPMGDCNLKEIKEKYGKKIALMGNLHTTEVMLKGSERDVEEAAKEAIDDAGERGGFLLSTGDQCGRDTPDENIFKLVEVARTYGRY